jgi:hypothetical protein
MKKMVRLKLSIKIPTDRHCLFPWMVGKPCRAIRTPSLDVRTDLRDLNDLVTPPATASGIL